ncbi:hypothetical protein [Lysobacter arvi]|uniref:hypothetical protein n=1 Tax=Lysobacter arvi TaxID=3038776 RepID=UPI00283A9C18|nr:hypothetical protein [Lysobacter arvi]
MQPVSFCMQTAGGVFDKVETRRDSREILRLREPEHTRGGASATYARGFEQIKERVGIVAFRHGDLVFGAIRRWRLVLKCRHVPSIRRIPT